MSTIRLSRRHWVAITQSVLTLAEQKYQRSICGALGFNARTPAPREKLLAVLLPVVDEWSCANAREYNEDYGTRVLGNARPQRVLEQLGTKFAREYDVTAHGLVKLLHCAKYNSDRHTGRAVYVFGVDPTDVRWLAAAAHHPETGRIERCVMVDPVAVRYEMILELTDDIVRKSTQYEDAPWDL